MSINPTKLILGLATVPLAAGSAWLCGSAAKYGLHLDPSGVNAIAAAGLAGGVAVGVKLVHDVESELEKRDPKLAAAVGADLKVAEQAATATDPSLSAELAGAWPPPSSPTHP